MYSWQSHLTFRHPVPVCVNIICLYCLETVDELFYSVSLPLSPTNLVPFLVSPETGLRTCIGLLWFNGFTPLDYDRILLRFTSFSFFLPSLQKNQIKALKNICVQIGLLWRWIGSSRKKGLMADVRILIRPHDLGSLYGKFELIRCWLRCWRFDAYRNHWWARHPCANVDDRVRTLKSLILFIRQSLGRFISYQRKVLDANIIDQTKISLYRCCVMDIRIFKNESLILAWPIYRETSAVVGFVV